MTLSTTSPGDEREAAGWVNEWSDKHEVPLDNRARAELVAALSRQAPAAPAEAAWANFPSYLIDHCEGETITEEGLQRWLAEMLADPKYTGPTTTSVKVKVLGNGWVESGLAARDESGSYVMMLHPEATNSIPESDPPIQRPRAWSCSREAKGHGRCVAWCGVEPSCISSQSLAAPTPAEPQALLGWTRYEKARKLNPAQWAELHQRNLRGENFDDMIDALPATTMTQQEGWTYDKNGSGKWEPVQQDTRPPMQTWWFKELQEFWESSDSYITAAIKSAMDHIRATPPAEKQAAPSGEDNHG